MNTAEGIQSTRTIKISTDDGRSEIVTVPAGRNASTRAMARTTLRLNGQHVTTHELVGDQWVPIFMGQ